MMHFEIRATVRPEKWRDLIAALTDTVRKKKSFRNDIGIALENPR